MRKKASYNSWLPLAIFVVLLLWATCISIRKIRPLIPLYEDASLRHTVQEQIERALALTGNLGSSVRIESVDADAVQLSIRDFRRGLDTRSQLKVSLNQK